MNSCTDGCRGLVKVRATPLPRVRFHSLLTSHRQCRWASCVLLAMLTLTAVISPAFAQTVYTFTTTITTLGAQGQGAGGQFYVQPATNPQGCLNGIIYIQTGVVGNAQYATALAAFYSGRTLRLDYTLDSTNANICYAALIGGY